MVAKRKDPGEPSDPTLQLLARVREKSPRRSTLMTDREVLNRILDEHTVTRAIVTETSRKLDGLERTTAARLQRMEE